MQGTTQQNVAQSQETEFIEEVSGLTETGEIQVTAKTASITQTIATDQTSSRGRFNVGSYRGRGQARGRVDDILQDTPVRMIHMICLLPLCSSTRTKCYR